MGGIRKFKNRHARRERNQNRKIKPEERGPYPEMVRESAAFEKYYKVQNIVPESEWEMFLEALRQDLPAAFRISACNEKEAAILLNIVEGSFFKGLINTDDPEEQRKLPMCLPWYPKRLGWQVPISRKDIRRSETYFKLHNFLMSETASGNISRQEVVSMIPPLLLDVQPHHKVLDMCAAPGSKTAQLIEMMHIGDTAPSGVVIANDVDNSRCYMLVHQAKRLNSPCTLVTNHDASIMPNIYLEGKDGSNEILKFDRILCDVPCTGDGTMRKNPDIWKKWNPANSNNLHGMQMRIVKRALEMLAVGGRLVYSTCSLNPVEDEAVMHRILVEAKGAVELQDVSGSVPGLKYSPGVSKWIVGSKEADIYQTFEEVPESLHNMIRPAMFPPNPEEAGNFHLDRCLRVLPHHQDTGGFFIAVLEKLSLLPWESSKSTDTCNGDADETEDADNAKLRGPPQKRRRIQGYREDPFVLFHKEEPVWPIIRDFYDIKPELPLDCLMTRCASGKRKNIYFISPIIRDILKKNQEKVKIINAGVKAFARCDNKNSEYCFRLAQEGLASLEPYLGQRRRVLVTKDDLIELLMCTDPTHPPDTDTLDPATQEKLEDFGGGSCVLEYRGEDGLNLDLVGWRGKCSLRAYANQADCVHYLRLLGGDTSIFDKNKFKKEDVFKIEIKGEQDEEENGGSLCEEPEMKVKEEILEAKKDEGSGESLCKEPEIKMEEESSEENKKAKNPVVKSDTDKTDVS